MRVLSCLRSPSTLVPLLYRPHRPIENLSVDLEGSSSHEDVGSFTGENEYLAMVLALLRHLGKDSVPLEPPCCLVLGMIAAHSHRDGVNQLVIVDENRTIRAHHIGESPCNCQPASTGESIDPHERRRHAQTEDLFLVQRWFWQSLKVDHEIQLVSTTPNSHWC